MPTPVEPSSTSTPIAQVSYRTEVPSADTRRWYERRPTPMAIALGTAGALAFAILLGLLLSPSMGRADREPLEKASAPVATPQSLVDQFAFRRASERYQNSGRCAGAEGLRDLLARCSRPAGSRNWRDTAFNACATSRSAPAMA